MQLLFIFLHLTHSLSDDNWAILIDSSIFYFNYRHTVNTLLIYQQLKRFGFDDDHILLFLPENHQCHPRSMYPGRIYDGVHSEDLFQDTEIDYRGSEVSPASITSLLTNRFSSAQPSSKRLHSSKRSKIFLYFTGHGGNGYFKIQDTQVLKSMDLSNIIKEMHLKEMFSEMLIFIDSCQALSMYDYIETPGVHGLTSSIHGEPAKSYGAHSELGVSISDHFTYFFAEIFRGRTAASIEKMSVESVIKQLPNSLIKSHIGFKSKDKAYTVMLHEFFTSESGKIEVVESSFRRKELGRVWEDDEKFEDKWSDGRVKESKGDAVMAFVMFVVGTLLFYLTNVF